MGLPATPLPAGVVGDFPCAYLAAMDAYHAETPLLEWDFMVWCHLNRPASWFIATPSTCVAARLVGTHWGDAQILEPGYTDPDGETLHVYVAAGNLGDLMRMIPPVLMEQVKELSFQRRGYGLRRIPVEKVTKAAIR